MIRLSSSMAIVMPDQVSVNLFSEPLSQLGHRDQDLFDDSRQAYEKALKKQYEVFVLADDMPGMRGVVFIQKLRESMNYGAEQYLLVVDELNPQILNALLEYDVNYILTNPYTPDRIVQKFQHLVRSESSLSDAEQVYRKAKLMYANGFIDAAIEILNKATKFKLPNDRVFILLGDIAAKSGNLDSARAYYQSARQLDSMSVLAAQKLGATYLAEKNYERAHDLLDALTELNPFHIQLMVNAGITNFQLGYMDRAKRLLQKVRKLDLTHRESNETLAKIQMQEGDFSALAGTLATSHSEKELAAFLNNAGIRLSKDNDIEGALAMYESTLEHVKSDEYRYAIF